MSKDPYYWENIYKFFIIRWLWCECKTCEKWEHSSETQDWSYSNCHSGEREKADDHEPPFFLLCHIWVFMFSGSMSQNYTTFHATTFLSFGNCYFLMLNLVNLNYDFQKFANQSIKSILSNMKYQTIVS